MAQEDGAATLTRRVAAYEALAHPTRLRILDLLASGEQTVGQIAEAVDVPQPNTSQHLAILAKAGLVTVTPVANARYYSLRARTLERLLKLMEEFLSEDG